MFSMLMLVVFFTVFVCLVESLDGFLYVILAFLLYHAVFLVVVLAIKPLAFDHI